MSKLDLRKESEKRLKNKVSRKYKRDTKLQDLERQLEFAESRCGTLKQQLDYIKRLYGCGKSKLFEKESPTEEGHGDGTNIKRYSCCDFLKWNKSNEFFANREDGDGPDFKSATALIQINSSANSSTKNLIQERDEPRKKTSAKSKALKLKMKKKTARKVKKKRPRIEPHTSSKVSNASSQTLTQVGQDPVVELYKNGALNVESESGMETLIRSATNKRSGVFSDLLKQKLKKVSNHRRNEENNDLQTKSCGSINAKKEEAMQTDLSIEIAPIMVQNKPNDIGDFYNKEATAKVESTAIEPVKNYCMPTISSKRKQVDRDIYSSVANINVRSIPFVVAKSTAPSHNIGINIQQVLSIMKKRHPVNENLITTSETTNHDIPVLSAMVNSKKPGSKPTEHGPMSEQGTEISSELKRRNEAPRTSLSHWAGASEVEKERPNSQEKIPEDSDWSLKIEKLKKVLIFLHEDFTSLSMKYKRLQKKLTKRNITRTDAKDELAEIERELEKKEEEITVVIGLYKEVLNFKEAFRKLQEKYDLVACGRNFPDGLRQSNSAHTQMTSLLRKIQAFQDKLTS